MTNRQKTSVTCKSTAIILALIIAAEVSMYIALPLMEKFLIIQKPLSHADALVVMAGGETRARITTAAKLYHSGLAKNIILTNDGILGAWSERKNRNLLQVEWMEMELQNRQVPDKAIFKLAYSSSGTFYDALMTRTEVLKNRFDRIIIVTSDYHTRRALWTFEKVFSGLAVEIGVYPASNEVSNMYKYSKFIQLTREMIKYLYYINKYTNIKI
jgi:uncharacterized SAM-binding protein YcdF (DUF218 family)